MAKPGELPTQPRRSPFLRILAPLALVAAVIVLLAVISSSLGDEDSDGGQRTGGGGGQQAKTTSTDAKADKPPKTYTVEPGDSISVIAERFGVSEAEVLDLNPDVDPQALVAGEELKLR